MDYWGGEWIIGAVCEGWGGGGGQTKCFPSKIIRGKRTGPSPLLPRHMDDSPCPMK